MVGAMNSEARKRLEERDKIELMKHNPYREYFLAMEENGRLCETVGVSKEEFDANQERLQKATDLCYAYEDGGC